MPANSLNSIAYANKKNRVVFKARNFWSGLLFGVGLAAFIDEVGFHLLLQWHHFYDQSTLAVGLLSDGLFHAFGWFATISSLFLFADLRRRNAFWGKRWIGAMLFGLAAFQLYDGLVQHKLLRLHQIRYNVDIFPYDLVWNIAGASVLGIGAFLLLQTRKAVKKPKEEE
ncbi:DUF2243 domain-containing protein [Planococcus sp. 107-1]|uniref:DUF2243 domain-containing protein n=1 Tax=Planococcus sp. 107-1 TaxID=2908840 RepID=UPI001F174E4D|nr:DUF2243 domain-containing protein [Planococcus sp. 107-1]UJF26502.1 DUF2243 domain-containing protein [Planococcus sp. 107-1]